MSIIEALVLGLIQGLTEFIPVSSSGHLLIAHEVFGSEESSLVFDVALHVGTLLALLIYFRNETHMVFRGGVDMVLRRSSDERRLFMFLAVGTLPLLFVAASGISNSIPSKQQPTSGIEIRFIAD